MDSKLAEQNRLTPWRDCNAGRRMHHWRPDFQVRADGGRIVAWWWRCARCPVSTRTTVPVMPAGMLS